MTLEPPTRTRTEEELLDAGWKRRFVGAPPTLQERVELYESLGKEVHLEPLDPAELDERCDGCRLALRAFRVVYTRDRRSDRAGGDEGRFDGPGADPGAAPVTP